MNSKLYLLLQARLWGDYGNVLISGYGTRDQNTKSMLLHRAGPFAPPIFFPSVSLSGASIIVTQSFRSELESSALAGIQFRPVVKNRIIDYAWHTWDRGAPDPAELPGSGEPEDYIWNGKHSRRTAAEMEELWEVLPPVIECEIDWEESDTLNVPPTYWFAGSGATYRGLFRSKEEHPYFVVDDTNREWFEEHVGEWVRFEPLLHR